MLTPRETVKELDKYIIGQTEAKKSVSIALRNRWRRQQVSEDMREEILPKNIIMIGPTGVGKTEIARRLAKLANAPFIKVEASKFTEVGYVGKDVDSMVRELMEVGVHLIKQEEEIKVKETARIAAENRVIDLLLPVKNEKEPKPEAEGIESLQLNFDSTRNKLRTLMEAGKLDEREVEIEVKENSFPAIEIFTPQGMEEMDINVKEMLGNILPKRTKKRKMKIPEAIKYLTQEEAGRMIDMDKVVGLAKIKVEQAGIIFLDEIDKIVGNSSAHGPDVSREGVQRDILPIVEGSTVTTKYGPIKTDHVLFIAAGAFHTSKPSDLIPELQGRFPIRVELKSLTKNDFISILKETKNSLIKQYVEMMKTEGIGLEITEDAIEEMAEMATEVNSRTENIGARRLHTILEKIFEEISFNAPDMEKISILINSVYVRERLKNIIGDDNLSRFIL